MKPAIVTTTVPKESEALALAHLLVENKLVACVNIIGPVKSVYFWENKVVEDTEYKLLIKTFHEQWDQVRELIRSNHSYSVPEISLVLCEAVDDPYLKFLKNTITPL